MRLDELARFRQMAYRLFSALLLYPEKDRLEAVVSTAESLRERSDIVIEYAVFPHWQRLLGSLGDLGVPRTLEEQYVRVFMHNPEGSPCLPYESACVDPQGQAAGWVPALLEREYASAGLALSSSLRELPDHVSVELEFVAFLCSQEADAWCREDLDEGLVAIERQRTFLKRHLARWFPAWARQVVAADEEGMYSVVVETARAFIGHDHDLLGLLLDSLRDATEGVPAVAVGNTSPSRG